MNISGLPKLPCGKGCHSENMTLASWKNFIQNVFESVGVANITIQDSEPIMIFDTSYLKKLDHLLNSTPTRYYFLIIDLIPSILNDIKTLLFFNNLLLTFFLLSIGHYLTTWVGDSFFP